MTSQQRLVEILTNKGTLPEDWRKAVAAVDRGLFLPEVFEGVSKATDPVRWARRAYGDVPVVTQTDDGEQDGPGTPTSSSSMPSIMLEMLSLLDVRDGHRVGEVGAGTGLNAAWLAHRLGVENVVTIEYDPVVAEQARANLKAAGLPVTVITGDGMAGFPEHAPLDRVICTCTVREVPYAWVEQAPGGRIVTPWGGSFHSYSFVTLDVGGDGVASGRFSGYPAFMWARGHRGRTAAIADVYHDEQGEKSATRLDPRHIDGDADALFAVGTRVRDAFPRLHHADDGSDEATFWILADDRTSWATVEYVPGHETYEVEQYGPRRLWDEVETAYRWWEEQGRPPRDHFGLTVTPDGQQVWLDQPDHVVTTGTPEAQAASFEPSLQGTGGGFNPPTLRVDLSRPSCDGQSRGSSVPA
ncbi:methyltransferase domain-containing protein [Streptomyces sp. NPDC127190]|uniref:methyltransferase domain-containing protein n=1 Tax=unclassified Streptomyces TaxID=2593676 RepID=UPI0036437122